MSDFTVEGIHCAACVRKIEEAVAKVPGVQKAQLNFATRHLHVEGDVAALLVAEAVRYAGYEAVARVGTKRRAALLWPVFVAAPFVFLLWIGSLGEIVGLILASATSALLVLAYFRSVSGMNGLVLLGSAAALAESYLQVLGVFSGHLMLETASTILFFVSVGRILEARASAEATRDVADLIKIEKSEPVGKLVTVPPYSTVGQDGVLLSDQCELNLAQLSGEQALVRRLKGDELFAGSINGSIPFLMRITQAAENSRLAKMARIVETALLQKGKAQALVDQIAAYFTPVVMVLALLAGLIAQDVSRFVTVLVVACPCALGLAVPLILATACGHLAKRGILITDSSAFARAALINTLFLDKTGTLTTGKFAITEVVGEGLPVLASLLEQASHPLAMSFVEYASAQGLVWETATDVRQVWPVVSGTVDGDLYEASNLRHFGQQSDRTHVALAKQGKVLLTVYFADSLQEDAARFVDAARKQGLELAILSGDNQAAVQKVAEALSIARFYAGCRPEDKLSLIETEIARGRHLAMVGDGINDAPALAASPFSFSTASSTDLATLSASCLLTRPGLLDILHTLHVAKLSHKYIKLNLLWAFSYNLIMLPLAILGQLPPWMAGAAMSLSSLSVVLNSLYFKYKI